MEPSKRPLSPHLQIYKPQITSIMSISHRITGVALAVGTLLLTWWVMAAATSPAAFQTVRSVIGSPIGYLMLFGWSFALFYHMANGVRHLVWDAGHGLTIRQAEFSGYVTIAAAGALTLIAWIAGLIIMGSR
jgi:succinate dehydrogenase / fumarate reductase, cytochrome b subunit